MPVLSIVVPSYNMAPWLPVALESCLWQSWPDIEVIVVDRSTDESPSIIERYAALDPRVRLVKQEGQGLGDGRQVGQDAATGDYITWLDADDFLAPSAAELWLNNAERYNSDLVCANAVAFSDRTFNARRYFYHEPHANMTFDTSPAYWKSKVVWRWIFSLPFLRKHNLTHPNYKWGQDVCFMYDCLLRAKRFSQCEQFLYYFRQDHKNAETTVDVKVEHQLAHYVEVKRILTRTPDGIVRYKPLVKYLNENYWRDVRKLAPLLTGEDERWLRPALEIGRELFDGLDPSWFRAAALSPEVREQTEFLPLVDAFIRNDMDAANTIFLELRNNPPHVVDKNTPFHVLRHKIKAMFNPLSRHAKAQLRALETLAASRT